MKNLESKGNHSQQSFLLREEHCIAPYGVLALKRVMDCRKSDYGIKEWIIEWMILSQLK
jgi:hypothetical protein